MRRRASSGSTSGAVLLAQVAIFLALAQRIFQILLRPVVVNDRLRPALESRWIRLASQHVAIAAADHAFRAPVGPTVVRLLDGAIWAVLAVGGFVAVPRHRARRAATIGVDLVRGRLL